ncbi:GTPase [Cellulomonas alba]|uniref:50S ribosome-binding GTPase n=1 Tax=Cellulomonas alba TaxID=3053467 RepID=A0ABT7SIF5_9CELL|nr:GTPase [Cellulomonas alba]MDM7855945.1 50S ribosome-binding GTPase [Cellulomonas alba]
MSAGSLGEDGAELTARVGALREAVAVGGDRLDAAVVERVTDAVDRVQARLSLGVDHTIVALVGGTGSGKSTLFNAVSGLQFAEVGVKRPTTSEVTACVWGGDAPELLDWLGVARDRRIRRESELDGETEAPLRGLVLLDLPDHDSIAPEHREVVNRLLPQADLLMWVVDPQKYADDALHTGYLQRLVGHEGSMVVVLNQLDTVPEEQREELLADVERLLLADGLTGVPVIAASARTGTGVGALRGSLTNVVASRSLAAQRVGADVRDAADELATQVADREPPPGALVTNDAVDTLAGATGLPAVASAVAAGVRGVDAPGRGFGPVSHDVAALARAQWLGAATSGLPRRWAGDADARAASAAELRDAVTAELASVSLMARRSGLALGLTVLAVLLGVVALGFAAVGVGSRLGGGGGAWWPLVAAGVALVAGVAALLGAAAVRRAAAGRRAAAVLRDGRAAVERAVQARLVAPVRQVVDEHRRVRELTDRARG